MEYCTRNPTLKKPGYGDPRNITDINDNMDYIDSILSKMNLNGATDPTSTNDIDDGYAIGSWWLNKTDHKLFIAEVVTADNAVWRQVYPPCDGTTFAPAAQGVTNGNTHDHAGGDGGQVDHAGLANLTTGDPHTQYATNKIRHIEFVVDGGGFAIATGIKGDIRVGYACTIKKATLLAHTSGSIVVNIWKCTYTQYDDSAHPGAGDKITASAPPTITTDVKSKDSTLTGWTVAVAADDVLRFNVDSCTSITRCTVDLEVEVTR